MAAKRILTDADHVWNRACFREVDGLRDGDRALGAVLLVDGYIKNGGVGHAFDLDPAELAEGITAFEYFGLHDLVAIIKPHGGDSEKDFNNRYYSLEGRGGHRIRKAFDEMYVLHPERFAPVGGTARTPEAG